MGGMSFSDYLIHLSSLHVPLGEEHVRTHPWHHLPGFRRSSKWWKEVVRSGGSSLESVFGLPWGWSSQLKLAAQPTASWCWTGSETQKQKTLKNVGNSESKREEFSAGQTVQRSWDFQPGLAQIRTAQTPGNGTAGGGPTKSKAASRHRHPLESMECCHRDTATLEIGLPGDLLRLEVVVQGPHFQIK